MSKRNYTHIKILEPEILAMKGTGKTKREIAEHYGLKMGQSDAGAENGKP